MISKNDPTNGKKNNPMRMNGIAITVLISLFLVSGIMIFNYRRTYQNARNDVIELSKSSSVQNAERIELFFTRHADMLLATEEIFDFIMADGTADGRADEGKIQAVLRKLSDAYNSNIYKKYANEDFTGIYAAVNGRLIHAYKGDEDLPAGYDPTKRQWYREGMEGGGAVVFGEPYFDVYNPEVQVMTVTKLLSDGETVIGMDITLKDMQHAGGNMDVSVSLNGEVHTYGHGLIMTAKGIVAAHWDKNEQGKAYFDLSNSLHDTFMRIKEHADSGRNYLETDINGERYGVFPQKLVNGWYVVTMTDFDDIRTAISDFAKLIFVGMVLIIGIGVAYCFFILKAYARSEKLTVYLQDALDLAKLDTLTNLGNRTAYDIRIRELKERDEDEDAPFALIMLDLNDLKYINDHYGHVVGDRYIINCGELIRSIFPCSIYRIGGDEFALILEGEAFDERESLLKSLKQAVEEANRSVTPDADKPSIAAGVAIHTAGQDDIDEVVRKADTEMYTNKVTIKTARLNQSAKERVGNIKLEKLKINNYQASMKSL